MCASIKVNTPFKRDTIGTCVNIHVPFSSLLFTQKSFSELKYHGSFGASHLCIYRWAGFCTSLDHTHPLYPLVWQRFFNLYLARAPATPSS